VSVEGLETGRHIRVFVVAEVCLYRQGLTLILHSRGGICCGSSPGATRSRFVHLNRWDHLPAELRTF